MVKGLAHDAKSLVQ